ncbi:hypothetical protein [Mucilaginibacter sp.]|uniref:hypothetical protein n=1 Tax=Mucilaginibacter sp. TaxID=1882438 RepID=UPI0026272186|nr:hypothetical protein [Mucilaginibacter sp.]MDB4925510.1 hypothetical protein [Mucilaginibacter sp.]
MLHQITWQQYLLFVAAALLLYYALIWLTFYRGKTAGLFSGKRQFKMQPEPGDEWGYNELLGNAAEEYGVSTAESGDLYFGATHPFPDNEALYGLIPDVLEEIKSVIHTVTTEQGTKDDFRSLFKLVAVKYPQLKTSPHLEAINEWIGDNVPFTLSEDELYQLWEYA